MATEKSEKETFKEWEERKHRERLEREAARIERDKANAELFAKKSETHRLNMEAAVVIMREIPAMLAGLAEALGYAPNVKVTWEGIIIEGKERK